MKAAINEYQNKTCSRCKKLLPITQFAKTHSTFYEDGYLPICNRCITAELAADAFKWDHIDKVCQYADIPFIPKEWERIKDMSDDDHVWPSYARLFCGDNYKAFGWGDYQKQFQELRAQGFIDEEIPGLHEAKIAALKQKWGANYDEESLYYLEDLYVGLQQSQNVVGALQIDQAKKICKLSLEIDSRIRAGDKDVDKFLGSYDKLVKSAEFTPKNIKNAADFDSFGELAKWLEKRGRQNNFYDNVTRDVIDETLKNIEAYNQRLYVNEGGLGEEISERLSALNSVNKTTSEATSDTYSLNNLEDADVYDNDTYSLELQEFDPTGDDTNGL